MSYWKVEFFKRVNEAVVGAGFTKLSLWHTGIGGAGDKGHKFPKVFMEFMDVNYGALASGGQEISVRVAFHLLFVATEYDPIKHLELEGKLFLALQQLVPVDGWTPMFRVEERIDDNFDQLFELVVVYSCSGIDVTAVKDGNWNVVEDVVVELEEVKVGLEFSNEGG